MMGRGSTNKRHQPTSEEKLSQNCAKPASASEEAGLGIHSVKDATDFPGIMTKRKPKHSLFVPGFRLVAQGYSK